MDRSAPGLTAPAFHARQRLGSPEELSGAARLGSGATSTNCEMKGAKSMKRKLAIIATLLVLIISAQLPYAPAQPGQAPGTAGQAPDGWRRHDQADVAEVAAGSYNCSENDGPACFMRTTGTRGDFSLHYDSVLLMLPMPKGISLAGPRGAAAASIVGIGGRWGRAPVEQVHPLGRALLWADECDVLRWAATAETVAAPAGRRPLEGCGSRVVVS
jgi:hypothetical protein